MAIANGSRYYMPPANVVRMIRDLAFLPAYMGNPGDLVLVKELPDNEFMFSTYRRLNLSIRCVQEEDTLGEEDLQAEPWGWSPNMCHWFAAKGMGEEWRPEQKEWYSRKLARKGLNHLLGLIPELDPEIIPELCFSIDDIESKMGKGSYLVKAPWSSSGKGILVVKKPIAAKEKEWVQGILKRQEYVMLEKKWEKVQDFAMEFRKGDSGSEFIGWSVFTTGNQGEYKGNLLGTQAYLEDILTARVAKEKLEWLKLQLPVMLDTLLPTYRGCLGVDMMIYTDAHGEYKLQPCLEINLRYNMGILALELSRRYLTDSAKGEFSIRYYSCPGEARQECLRLQQLYPVVYKNNRIQSGYLNLTPLTEATHFIASINCY